MNHAGFGSEIRQIPRHGQMLDRVGTPIAAFDHHRLAVGHTKSDITHSRSMLSKDHTGSLEQTDLFLPWKEFKLNVLELQILFLCILLENIPKLSMIE